MRLVNRNLVTFRAVRLALIYGVVASVWIFFSGRLALELTSDSGQLARFETFKGLVFVIATSLLLFVLAHREIRSSVAARQRQQLSEEQLSILVNNIQGYSVVLLDPQGRILNWNTGAERNSGYSPQQAQGQHIRMFYPPEDREAGLPEQILADAARLGCVQDEGWRVRADGQRRWLDATYTAIRGADGGLLGYAAVIRDITDRRETEQALEEERRGMAAAIKAIPGIFFVVDKHGRLNRWNRELERVTGLSAQTLSGLRALALVPEDERPQAAAFTDEVTTTGRAKTEINLKGAGGATRPFLLTATSFAGHQGRCLVGTGYDLSEYRQLLILQSRQAAIIEATPDVVGMTDSSGQCQYLNSAGRRLLGLTPGEDPRKTRMDRQVIPEDRPLLNEGLRQAAAEGIWRGEIRLCGADGEVVPVSQVMICHRDAEGRPEWWSSICRDIRPQKSVERALRESEQRYRTLYDRTPSMLFTIAASGRIQAVNEFCSDSLGRPPDYLVGRAYASLHQWEHRAAVRRKLRDCLQAPDIVHRWEACLVPGKGDGMWVRASARVIRDEQDQPAVLVACEDITETRQLSEELSYRASHDLLTGLVNRSELERRLQRLLERARHQGGQHALCYLDLDRFRLINDTLGHEAGDELLRQLSEVLCTRIDRSDTTARLGGDDFAVLLENCSADQAMAIAERLREQVRSFRFDWEGHHYELGVSIGVVPVTPTSEDANGLLRMAEASCEAAKETGRNRIHLYDEEDETLARRHGEMQWATRIPLALEQDRFRLFCQPIQAIGNNRDGLHYEILLRMEDEQGQLIGPASFLTASERYNLTPRLDRWVVGHTLRFLREHPTHLNRLSVCAINLSGLSLGDRDFLDFVMRELEHSKIPPRKICFEITETAAVSNLLHARRFIDTLAGRGCRFALDDFGVGLSSFSYLKNLRVDYLKIDGSFVRDMLNDPIDLSLVRSINDVGHAMHKATIAEFVENRAILDKLSELGVDYAQGYQTGRPRPLSRLAH